MAVNFAIVNRVLAPNGARLAVQYNDNAILTLVVFDPLDIPEEQRWTRVPAAGDSAVVSVLNPAEQARPNGAGDFVAAVVPGHGVAAQLWNFNINPPAPEGTRIQQVGGAGAGRVWGVNNAVLGAQVTLAADNNALFKRWVLFPAP